MTKKLRSISAWMSALAVAATLSALQSCNPMNMLPPTQSSTELLKRVRIWSRLRLPPSPPPSSPGAWHGGKEHGPFRGLLRRKGMISAVPACGLGLRGGGWERTEGGGWHWVGEGGKVAKGEGAQKIGTRKERRMQRRKDRLNSVAYPAQGQASSPGVETEAAAAAAAAATTPGVLVLTKNSTDSKASKDSKDGPTEAANGKEKSPPSAVPGPNQISAPKAKASAWAPPVDLDIPLPPRPFPKPPAPPPLVNKEIVEQLVQLSNSGGATDKDIALLRSEGVTEAEFEAASLLPSLPRSFNMTAADGTPIPRGRLGLFPRWSSSGLVGSDTSAGLQPLLPAAPKTLALTAGITMPGGQMVRHASTDLVERRGTGELALRSMDESFAVSVPVKGGPALGGNRAIMTSEGLVYRDKSLEEWPASDFRLWVGDLGQHVTDQDLTETFRSWPGFNMARIVKDKVRRWRCRGYGFVSFATEEARSAVIAHQRRGKDSIEIYGRPVVVKASQWMKKVMTPEKLPEVRRIREKNEKLVGEGKLLPEAIGRPPKLGGKGRAWGGRLRGPNHIMLGDGDGDGDGDGHWNSTGQLPSVSEEWKSDEEIVYDARADFGGMSWHEAFAEDGDGDGPELLDDGEDGPGNGMEFNAKMKGNGIDDNEDGDVESSMGMEEGVEEGVGREGQGDTSLGQEGPECDDKRGGGKDGVT